jgi:hypothetical protein
MSILLSLIGLASILLASDLLRAVFVWLLDSSVPAVDAFLRLAFFREVGQQFSEYDEYEENLLAYLTEERENEKRVNAGRWNRVTRRTQHPGRPPAGWKPNR